MYYFVTTAILPTGDVHLQSRSARMIQENSDCQRLIGSKMKIHGEPTENRWARNRPVVYVSRDIFYH